MKKCKVCNKLKQNKDFYRRVGRKKKKFYHQCKKCFNKICTERQRRVKEELVIFAGGKCVSCGIRATKNNIVIFDFHHLDPKKKEFSLKASNKSVFSMINEILKCVLICSNCHRLEHSRLNN